MITPPSSGRGLTRRTIESSEVIERRKEVSKYYKKGPRELPRDRDVSKKSGGKKSRNLSNKNGSQNSNYPTRSNYAESNIN